MSVENCVNGVVQEIEKKRKLTAEEKAEITKFAEELDAQVEALKTSADMADRKAGLEALKELMQINADKLKAYKETFLNDVIKTQEHIIRLDAAAKTADGKLDTKKALDYMVDLIDGDNSVDTGQRIMSNNTKSVLKNELIKNKIEDVVRSGEFDKEIYVAFDDISKGKTPTFKNPEVQKAVEAFRKVNDFLWKMTNDAGIKIGKIEGYLLRQGNYDRGKVANVSREEFVSDMMNALDKEKMFSKAKLAEFEKNPDSFPKFLSEMYDDMTSAKAEMVFGETTKAKSYKDKMKSRVLEFKDGDSAWGIEQKYGRDGNLIEKLELQIESNATFIANAQKLGVNASKNLAKIAEYVRANGDDADAYARGIKTVNSAFVNTVAPPHSPMGNLGKLAATARALAAFSKLGSSVVTATYDVIPSALQYSAHSGKGIISSFAESVATFASTVARQSADDIAEQLGIVMHIDPLIHMGLSSAQSKNFLGQKVNKFMAGFSTFTGVPLQTKYSRAVGALLHARNFDQMLRKGPNEFQLKNLKEKYGFSDADLADLNALKRQEVSGANVLTPRSIMESGLEPKRAQELFFKYSSYIDDVVHKNTPQATARTKRQLGLGYNQDQTTRELLSMVMQFKETAWKNMEGNAQALKMIQDVGGKGALAVGVAETLAVTSMTYLGIESARALMFNQKNPLQRITQDEEYYKTALDFINRSAFAGPIGDAVTAGLERGSAGDIGMALLGPNFSVATDAFMIGKTAIDAARGKKDAVDIAKKTGKFIERNMLPSNWWGVKAPYRWLSEQDLITGRKFNK